MLTAVMPVFANSKLVLDQEFLTCTYFYLQVVHCAVGESFVLISHMTDGNDELWDRDDIFLFLRNSSHLCACDWGPSEFKNLHGVVYYT